MVGRGTASGAYCRTDAWAVSSTAEGSSRPLVDKSRSAFGPDLHVFRGDSLSNKLVRKTSCPLLRTALSAGERWNVASQTLPHGAPVINGLKEIQRLKMAPAYSIYERQFPPLRAIL